MSVSNLFSSSGFHRMKPYLVVLGAMWINICNLAFLRSASVLYMAFMDEFHCTYEEATWTFTLVGGVASIACTLAGFMSHYLPVRLVVSAGIVLTAISIWISSIVQSVWPIIFMGGVQGFGIGLFVSLLPTLLAQHFEKGRSTACGFCYAGCTISTIIFPRLIQYMLFDYSLNTILEMLAGVSALGLFGALLLFPAEQSKEDDRKAIKIASPDIHSSTTTDHHLENGKNLKSNCPPASILETIFTSDVNSTSAIKTENGVSCNHQMAQDKIGIQNSLTAWTRFRQDLKLLRNGYFQLVTLVYVIYIFTYLVYFIVLQAFAEERGLSKLQANSLIMYFSCTDLIGRLFPGLLHLTGIMSNKNAYVISIVLLGVSFALMPILAHDLVSFVVLVMITGLMNGVQMTMPAVVMSEYLGVANTAMGFGFSNFISGITAFFRPSLIGYVKNSSGLYDLIFYFNAVFCILSAVPWFFEAFSNRKRKTMHVNK